MALKTAPSRLSIQSSIWKLQLPMETVSETNTSPHGTHQTTRRQKETGLCFPHTGDGNRPRSASNWEVSGKWSRTYSSLPGDPAAQVNAYFTPSEPRRTEGEWGKDGEFCLAWVCMWELGHTLAARPAGCSYRLSGHIRVCRRGWGLQGCLQATRDRMTPSANLFDRLSLRFCVLLLH